MNEPDEVIVSERRRIAKPAAFVLVSVMFKRYSTAAILSILTLFLNLKLGYDKDVSTTVYHSYAFVASCFAIVGAIIADSRFGMYKTIVVVSVVFAVGSLIIAIGVIDALHLPIHVLSVIGLLIMAIGDGCLKPLNRTYGACQYHPNEAKSVALFFVLYYFVYNIGSIISRLVSPILREDVQCFGNDDCFTAAFGISGICMILVALLTVIAHRYSETTQADGSSLLNVFACIWHAISKKIRSKMSHSIPAKDHWLDYSEAKYGKILVWETRVILRVLVLYLPITLFWALFYQQGSRWVFQAVRMNGDIGFYTIIPDQFNVINPLLVLLLIPVFENVLNPMLAKVRIIGDLQKATLGGVLGGIAFLVSAVIEFELENGKYLHMGWLLPQYTLMAMGEILVTVPIFNFSYTIAPNSMKTVLQAFNNLSMGLGNLIVVIVVGSKLLNSQIYEFILFAGLMFVDMILFAYLAKKYKPLKENADERVELIK
ncbi:peptide transporter family 1-like [Bradysia coprophila]|uniref:peptide transporter family 1-like n=1 Tax=Bradysia coprophila TaxID=38358 RepID=UPI00187DC32A|nr:peptide transporter family 1-like [Bradysia coprophila]